MMATVSGDGSHRVEGFVDGDLSSALDDRAALRHLRGLVHCRRLQDAVAGRALADRAFCYRAVLFHFVDRPGEWIAAVHHRGSQLREPRLPLLQDASLSRGRLRHAPTRINERILHAFLLIATESARSTRGGCPAAAAVRATAPARRKACPKLTQHRQPPPPPIPLPRVSDPP